MEDLIQKAGLSKAESGKIMNLVKSGKINMGQVAAKLNQQTVSTIADPHERIRAVLKAKREDRVSKEVKDQRYEQMRERVEKEKVEKAKAAEEKVAKAAAQKRNRTKKLKELAAKYGTITDEMYQAAMRAVAEPGDAKADAINHQKNIIDLYARQNKFTEAVDFAELDDF